MSCPKRDHGCERDGGEEVCPKLVVARGGAAEVLEATEHGFNPPTVSVSTLVVTDRALPIDATRDDRRGFCLLQRGAEPARVVTAIGDQASEAYRRVHEIVSSPDVGGVARRELQRDGTAEEVTNRVDFGCSATTRDADGLRLRPPFAPCAERWAFT
jgi:hypothetical protein